MNLILIYFSFGLRVKIACGVDLLSDENNVFLVYCEVCFIGFLQFANRLSLVEWLKLFRLFLFILSYAIEFIESIIYTNFLDDMALSFCLISWYQSICFCSNLFKCFPPERFWCYGKR